MVYKILEGLVGRDLWLRRESPSGRACYKEFDIGGVVVPLSREFRRLTAEIASLRAECADHRRSHFRVMELLDDLDMELQRRGVLLPPEQDAAVHTGNVEEAP
jgi:hypothetical protein